MKMIYLAWLDIRGSTDRFRKCLIWPYDRNRYGTQAEVERKASLERSTSETIPRSGWETTMLLRLHWQEKSTLTIFFYTFPLHAYILLLADCGILLKNLRPMLVLRVLQEKPILFACWLLLTTVTLPWTVPPLLAWLATPNIGLGYLRLRTCLLSSPFCGTEFMLFLFWWY